MSPKEPFSRAVTTWILVSRPFIFDDESHAEIVDALPKAFPPA